MCDGRLDCASGEDEEHCVKDFPDKPGVAGEFRDRRAGTAGELGSVVASDHMFVSFQSCWKRSQEQDHGTSTYRSQHCDRTHIQKGLIHGTEETGK